MYQRIIYTQRTVDAPEINTSDLVTLSDAAGILGVTLQTVDYHIKSGHLTAVMSDEEELTAYRQPRRWVLRNDVERLRVALLESSLHGDKWAFDRILVLTLPEDTSGLVTKSAGGNIVLRHITLDAQDTGNLEVDAKAIQDDDENCTVVIDCQSETMYPDMSGIAIVLHLAAQRFTGITGRNGVIRFTQVPISMLDAVRITVTPPDDPQPA